MTEFQHIIKYYNDLIGFIVRRVLPKPDIGR